MAIPFDKINKIRIGVSVKRIAKECYNCGVPTNNKQLYFGPKQEEVRLRCEDCAKKYNLLKLDEQDLFALKILYDI